MFNFSLNNMIDASAGLTLLHLSLSGLMCGRNSRQNNSSQCSSSNSESSCPSKCVSERKSCAMSNFNLGASAAGVTGVLLLYRGLRH